MIFRARFCAQLLGMLMVASLCLADECTSARNAGGKYLQLIAQLAENGFTNEEQLKDLGELVRKQHEGHNLGYYIYTSAGIESCSNRMTDQVELILRYEIVGHVALDTKKPRKLPVFSKVQGVKRILLSFRGGRIDDVTATDPFYPPIVAIQDFQERMGTATGEFRTNYRSILDLLETKQKIYLKTKPQTY